MMSAEPETVVCVSNRAQSLRNEELQTCVSMAGFFLFAKYPNPHECMHGTEPTEESVLIFFCEEATGYVCKGRG